MSALFSNKLLNITGKPLGKIALAVGLSAFSSIGFAQSQSATVVLNHLFMRLDVNTIAEITAQQKYLDDVFSDVYAGESGDANNKWNAVYIQGDNTYLELFDSNGSSTQADVGIAMGVDRKGVLKQSLAAYSEACTQPFICEVENRVRAVGDPLWFQQFKVLDKDKKLDTWVMEYGYEAVAKKPSGGGANDVSRKRYNSEFYQPHTLLKDIEEVYLTVTADQYLRLNNIGKAMENVIMPVVIGEGLTKFHVTVGNAAKVTKIVMSLNRNAKPMSLKMGSSELSLKGSKAVWTFN